MKYLWALLLVSGTVLGLVEPYKTKLQGHTPVCDHTYIELPNLPPVRDQGRFGLCYAHSSLLLLEHLRCSRAPSPQNCYKDAGSVLHLSRFQNTQSEEKIKIGGDPESVLSRFAGTRKLSRENCAKYEDWQDLDQHYKTERKAMHIPSGDISESDYFYYISRQIKQNKASPEAKNCWAQEIIAAGIQHDVQDLMAILNSAKDKTWQELRYEVLVPKKCLASPIIYPEFKQFSFPSHYNEAKSYQGFRNFAYQILKEGYPVEASFCSSSNPDGTCGYHTATLTGQREVCNLTECRLQFKMQNSYGSRWQQLNDNGWIDAENLTSLMGDRSMGMSAILPKGINLSPNIMAPYYVHSPVNGKATKVGLTADGKSGSANETCWRVDPSAYQYENKVKVKPTKPTTIPSPSSSVTPGKQGVYVCKKNGQTVYASYPQEGMDCQEKKY